jgi:hypothetical protein
MAPLAVRSSASPPSRQVAVAHAKTKTEVQSGTAILQMEEDMNPSSSSAED